ncbi:MAG: hypothetical protein JRI68_20720 [Deltaproteobacteria bacterium]|nr:hypothetical protein [Deltaproteobacteria bacterium]
MIIECTHCGAPLDTQPNTTLARCAYCGTTQRVKSARTQYQQTPPNWNAPRQWTPPPQFKARSVPLQFDHTKTVRKVVLFVIIITAVTTILPIAIFVIVLIAGAVASSSSSSSPSRSKRTTKTTKKKSKSHTMVQDGNTKKVCAQAAKCCRKVTPDTSVCDTLEQAGQESTCRSALDGFKQVAKAQGLSCE